jgi:hypothetical protein
LPQGVIINALPLMPKRPDGFWNIDNLDLYFRDCVASGPGASMITVREKAQFAEAFRTKIVRKIAARSQVRPLAQRARTEERANCFAGEIQQQNRGQID